MKVTGTVLAIW